MDNLCCILSIEDRCPGYGRNFGCEVHKPEGYNMGPLLCYHRTHDGRGCWKPFQKWMGEHPECNGIGTENTIVLWVKNRTAFAV